MNVFMEEFESAEVVKTASGKQYHINLGPEDVAPRVILVGDPSRSKKVADFFDEVTFHTQNREFVTYKGVVDGLDIMALSTGIGPDNIEITVIELVQVFRDLSKVKGREIKPTMIRVGSCGALQPFIDCGDLIVSTGAVRLENTSLFFVPEGYPAVADFEVVLALINAAERLGCRYHVGLTGSASGFYGAQGRAIEGFPLRYPDLDMQLSKLNVYNFEMESSALFTFANMQGIRAGMVAAAYANRVKNVFIPVEEKPKAEQRAIQTAIEAFKILEKMDRVKEKESKKYWMPSMSIK
ncbi:MAG: nucleoside phosphorylase [Candidatus Korarchaeota archaeon]